LKAKPRQQSFIGYLIQALVGVVVAAATAFSLLMLFAFFQYWSLPTEDQILAHLDEYLVEGITTLDQIESVLGEIGALESCRFVNGNSQLKCSTTIKSPEGNHYNWENWFFILWILHLDLTLEDGVLQGYSHWTSATFP
jgi:hypothetical protein